MYNNMHTPNKTPLRRLGLVRSVKKAVPSESTTVTPKPCPSVIPSTSHSSTEDVSTPVPNKVRPIKGTCSVDSSSDSSDEAEAATPVTPASTLSSCKRIRLSLSQSWRNRIIQKKELNLKRRKLMDEVELCSAEPDSKEQKDPEVIPSTSRLEAASDETNAQQKPFSSIQQKINDLNENILIWRAGCVQALTDLQEKRGTGDMESLLNMLQIPHELVNYDPESQDFLDPD